MPILRNLKTLFILGALFSSVSYLQAEPRFVNHGDGTVTDNNTGLIWQRCSGGLEPPDCSGRFGHGKSWQQSIDYCRGLDLADREWRLPSSEELETILGRSRPYTGSYIGRPRIDHEAFPNTPRVAWGSTFWSSTPFPHNHRLAYSVNFVTGTVYQGNKTYQYFARCVSDS